MIYYMIRHKKTKAIQQVVGGNVSPNLMNSRKLAEGNWVFHNDEYHNEYEIVPVIIQEVVEDV